MTEWKRLNDVFRDWQTIGGIFAKLQFYDVPWKTPVIAASLDTIYFGNMSGHKIISPMVNTLLGDDDILSSTQMSTIAGIIFNVYNVNWTKQWNTMSFNYNPIENYSMTEKMTDDETVSEYGKKHTTTNDLTHLKTGTETDTPDITETQTPDITNITKNSVNGFNSVDDVPTDTQNQKSTGSNINTQTGTQTRDYNVSDKDTGTQVNSDSGKDTQTRNYNLTRSGNIGVTTSQQMIESERALWVWNFFNKVVFPDIDRVLTLQIY